MLVFSNRADASLFILVIVLAAIFLTGIFVPFYSDVPFIPKPTLTLQPSQTAVTIPPTIGQPTKCNGTIVSFGVPKKLIPIAPWPLSGRPGLCMKPNYIVLHTTGFGGNDSAEVQYQFFARGADGRGAAAAYAIGKQGDTIQMVESLQDQFEVAYAVGNYADQVSIEICNPGPFKNKFEATPAQYAVVLRLVRALMKQYNIPLGNLGYTWRAPDNQHVAGLQRGVYGHYQLNPLTKVDPGDGFLRDVRQDLAAMP